MLCFNIFRINEVIGELFETMSQLNDKHFDDDASGMALRFLVQNCDLSDENQLRKLITARFNHHQDEIARHSRVNKGHGHGHQQDALPDLSSTIIARSLRAVDREEARLVSQAADELTDKIMKNWTQAILSDVF